MAAECDGKKNAGTSRMGTCGTGIVLVACCAVSAAALAASRDVTGAWSRRFCVAAGGSGKRIRIAFLCSVEESALWS